MKYTTPLYEKSYLATNDIVCVSAELSIYENDNGETVQEITFDFSNIIR